MFGEHLTTILRSLNGTSPDITASGVVSRDGLIIAAVLSQGMDEDRIGAMSAAILSVGDRAAQELVRSPFEQLMIKGPSGDVLMVHAGPEAVLSVVAKSNSELGLIYPNAKRAAESIAAAV